MKIKNVVAFGFLFFSFFCKAQVGIGTTTPNAQLDVTSSNQATPVNTDGILIPKIDAFPVTNPTVLQQGMLVYLTTTATFSSVSKPPGFYYWNNATTNWIGFQNSSSTDWNILGNASTSPATNFFGTTDNQDIVLKRNNIRAGYIGDPTIFSVGPTKYNNCNTVFGANSLLSPGIDIPNQYGIRNTAIGSNIMSNVTSGNNNTVMGDRALFTDSSGSNNTAMGVGALYTNSTGGFNTAIGRNALVSNSVGTNNTSLGYNSGFLATGSSSVFIGNSAGYNETGNNKLYIENSTADANNALVYGDFGTSPKILRANGQIQIGNPSVAGYALPTTRGITGQFLQTDGAGGTSWASNAYTTTGASTGTYTVTLAQYTIRVFGSISDIKLPTPVGNTGKIFVIIGSNGITSKGFTSTVGNIYDDVSAGFVTTINSNQRYMVQSDGTDWIVIAN